MLLTPLLSASPLVVPLVKNERELYLVDTLTTRRQDKPIANSNLRSEPIIRNWSDKPPDDHIHNTISKPNVNVANETISGVKNHHHQQQHHHVNIKDEANEFKIPLNKNVNLSTSTLNTSNLIDVVFNNSKFLSILSTESGNKNQKLVTRSIKQAQQNINNKYHSNSNASLQYDNLHNGNNNINNRTTNISYWLINNDNKNHVNLNDKLSDSVSNNNHNFVNSNYSNNNLIINRRSYDSNYNNHNKNNGINNNNFKVQLSNNHTENFYSKYSQVNNNINSELNRTFNEQQHLQKLQQHQLQNHTSFRDSITTQKSLPSSGYHTTSSFISYGE